MTSSLNDNSGNLQNKIKIFFREIARTFNEHYIQPPEHGWYVLTLVCFNSSQCSKNEKTVWIWLQDHIKTTSKEISLLRDCWQISPRKIWSQCLIQSIIVYKISIFPQKFGALLCSKTPNRNTCVSSIGRGTFIPSLSVIVKRVFWIVTP